MDLLNKKHLDLQTELDFTNATLALTTKIETPKGANLGTQKITELTRELGEQRKSNEVLERQLHELLESFSNYKSGHLRGELESNLKDKKDSKREPSIKDDPVRDSRKQRSPSWGRTRKEETPVSSDWDSKGESSASQPDFGWGPNRSRRHGKSRTPPRDSLGSKSLNLGAETETILLMQRGVHLLQETLIWPLKNFHKRKNGSRKVYWEFLSGKEPLKFEPI